jgi:phage terminase large subunit
MAKKMSDYIKLHPKQRQVMDMIGLGYYIFFGGARSGGKSYLALAACMVLCCRYPGLTCVVIRRTLPELRKNFIGKKWMFPEKIFGYRLDRKNNAFVFQNGSMIEFQPLDSAKDLEKVLGIEFQFAVLDEANTHLEDTIVKITGSLRKTDRFPGFVPSLLMTGNPGGRSDHWFKTHFISPDYSRWSPAELTFKDKFKYVFSSAYDNPSVCDNDPDYILKLQALPEHQRRAWLEGDWNVFFGQYFTEFNANIHVIPAFDIPDDWLRICGIDMGFTKEHPTVCLWLAQNPENFKTYVYREYTSSHSIETFIRDIKELSGDEEIQGYFCDPSMYGNGNRRSEADQSAAMLFMGEGMPLIPASNDRVTGWTLLKQWLDHEQHIGKESLMYFFEDCQTLITTLPSLQYVASTDNKKKMDLDTKGADDAADALRYAVISGLQLPTYTMQEIIRNAALNPTDDKSENDGIEWLRDKLLYGAYETASVAAIY